MKYRKKQVVIEAAQYEPGMEDGFSCIPFVSACRWKNEDGDYKQCMQCKLDIPKKPFISTLEGNDYIDDGDWIITGVNGKRYLCDPNIFEMTYEPVEMDIGAQQTSLDEDIPIIMEIGNFGKLKKLVGERIEAIYLLTRENMGDLLSTKKVYAGDQASGYIETTSGEKYWGDGDDYIIQTTDNTFLMSIGSCGGEACVSIECITNEVVIHYVWSEEKSRPLPRTAEPHATTRGCNC